MDTLMEDVTGKTYDNRFMERKPPKGKSKFCDYNLNVIHFQYQSQHLRTCLTKINGF